MPEFAKHAADNIQQGNDNEGPSTLVMVESAGPFIKGGKRFIIFLLTETAFAAVGAVMSIRL